jgi:hypothetical protein
VLSVKRSDKGSTDVSSMAVPASSRPPSGGRFKSCRAVSSTRAERISDGGFLRHTTRKPRRKPRNPRPRATLLHAWSRRAYTTLRRAADRHVSPSSSGSRLDYYKPTARYTGCLMPTAIARKKTVSRPPFLRPREHCAHVVDISVSLGGYLSDGLFLRIFCRFFPHLPPPPPPGGG